MKEKQKLSTPKKIIRGILSVISILLITFLFLETTQIRYDHNNIAIEGFYKEEKNSIDVVVLGASEVYSDYSPVYAYEKYGFTSYIFAIDDNPFVLYEWEIDEIYRYQDPKLVIVDISSVLPAREMIVGDDYFDACLRKVSDSVPISESKLELVQEFGVRDPLISYLYPPIKYHGRLLTPKLIANTLTSIVSFRLQKVSYLKGYLSRTTCKPVSKKRLHHVVGDDTKEPIPEDEQALLEEFLDHCTEKGYNVVFARFPHRIASDEEYYEYCQDNTVAGIIKEHGFDFIDFEQDIDQMGLNKIDDFSNSSHMRASGSKKMTDYLGKILTEDYGITPTELSESNKKNWDECTKYMDAFYELYEQEKDKEPNIYLQEDNFTLAKIRKLMDE